MSGANHPLATRSSYLSYSAFTGVTGYPSGFKIAGHLLPCLSRLRLVFVVRQTGALDFELSPAKRFSPHLCKAQSSDKLLLVHGSEMLRAGFRLTISNLGT